MAQYIDSGSGDPAQAIGTWLDEQVVNGIRGFRGQFGYFAFGALENYVGVLRETAEAGNPVHLVLGSNEGSLLASDLQNTWSVVEGTTNASLTVVSYRNAFFHPKTIHITRTDTSTTALVGSGNLTEKGLGVHVEAALILDTDKGDNMTTIQEIADAAERWHTLTQPSIFPIRSQQDIDDLLTANIIAVLPPPRPVRPTVGTTSGQRTQPLASRPVLWRPKRRPAVPAATPPILQPTIAPTSALRWCKQLRASDAQQVISGTNPTGKLRLSQAGNPIDHRTFFRNGIFSHLSWAMQIRKGNAVEMAVGQFDVTVRGSNLGTLSLVIDHAPHREAQQNNVPTILAWGSTLGRTLSSTSHIGDWSIIERDGFGNLSMTIQSARPSWHP